MDAPQEYEVESVTRARVHGKKGKKITWTYYVKWRGYSWDESTWEPTDSFQGGSEHFIESFWERIDTGGRDVSDASVFKKGEEFFISGPPGRNAPKRKANLVKRRMSKSSNDVTVSDTVTVSAPPLSPRKRRRVPSAVDDDSENWKLKRTASTGASKRGGTSRPHKRRRASAPGPRKSAPNRLPSVSDSQLDADGETDPDAVEVEDELMQVSGEDAEAEVILARNSVAASEALKGTKKIIFDDLEHFYSGNPIDIDQNADEQTATEKLEALPQPQSPPSINSRIPDNNSGSSPVPASPTDSVYDPLFDSPSYAPGNASKVQADDVLPHHRARAANPLVKFMDSAVIESTSRQSRITAKARLLSMTDTSGATAKRGRKPGPGRSSIGLSIKNRSSLLTASKGALKSVKGKFKGTTKRNIPDETEDDLIVREAGDKHHERGQQTTLNPKSDTPPSGDELLRLAGLQADLEPLPDYEDDLALQSQKAEEEQASTEKEHPDQTSAEVKEELETSDHTADALPSVTETGPQALITIADDSSGPLVVSLTVDETVKKNIELAKEHLFPSSSTTFNAFPTQSVFSSTIFGPLYQGSAASYMPVVEKSSTTFKVTLGDGTELPLILKDCSEIKGRISDILIGNSSGGKVAVFYSPRDALAMVSALKGDGTARVVLDPSAELMQQERFSALLERFQSSHTLIAPAGKEICVLYSSENAGIAEKLAAPGYLRGLSSTLLITHASIENQLAYVGAAMQATVL